MDVDLIFKIAAIGIIVSVLNLLLARSGREEQAILLSLAGVVFVLLIVMDKVGDLFHEIRAVFGI